VEEGEPDESAQHGHGDRAELDVRRVQLGRLLGVGGIGRDDIRRQTCGRHERTDEEHRSVHERGRRPDDLQQEARGDHRHRSGDAGDQAELGVGLDEFLLGTHRRRHDRRFRHGVGLLQHERGEHEREQRQRVEILRHQQGEDHPRQRHHLDDELAASGHAVDQRSDQRRDDQERSEPDHQEQQHARASGIEVDVEEQRVGERHHHGGVAAHHQRMGDREAAELGGGRSLRRVDPFHRADPM